MEAYRTEIVIAEDGTLSLRGLPFREGERVEVIVLGHKRAEGEGEYPLRGLPVQYEDPFGSVAEEEWNALRR